jgi:hypothetical protein
MIEEGCVDKTSHSISLKNLNDDTKVFETHRILSPKDSVKYYLRSTSKGSLEFHGKEVVETYIFF